MTMDETDLAFNAFLNAAGSAGIEQVIAPPDIYAKQAEVMRLIKAWGEAVEQRLYPEAGAAFWHLQSISAAEPEMVADTLDIAILYNQNIARAPAELPETDFSHPKQRVGGNRFLKQALNL